MPQATLKPTINEDRMHQFLGKVIGDFGASLSSALVYIGQKLKLYDALADEGPATPAELAKRTHTNERYVREWLINQAAGGYVQYDSGNGTYSLTPEQATALTDEHSPFYVGGGFFVIKAMTAAVPRIEEYFRSGGGMRWGDHDADLFVGTEKFFRPGYAAHLVSEWIPALSGIADKLRKGGKVADVGCGHGASTIMMAKAFPNSRFWGFDTHPRSIQHATEAAEAAAVSDRVTFKLMDAANLPNERFDLVCFFDCFHDMGDPLAAATKARESLADGGSVMLVEPMAGNTVEENFNPIGRTFAAASTLCCTANSLAFGGPALGAVAPEKTIKDVMTRGGFKNFRRVAETPFNRVFEARA